MTEHEAITLLLGPPPPPPQSWAASLKPGSCGMAMLEQARAAGSWSPDQLYNIARFTGTLLERSLAARLYVAEKELRWAHESTLHR